MMMVVVVQRKVEINVGVNLHYKVVGAKDVECHATNFSRPLKAEIVRNCLISPIVFHIPLRTNCSALSETVYNVAAECQYGL